MIFNIMFSLDSFKIISNVFIKYYKYFHVKKIKICNINTIWTFKYEKTQQMLHMWFLLV